MIHKDIVFLGKPCVLACDAQCHKAWGINNRSKVTFSADEDDSAWLADDELGTAPANPGTYEGGVGKPQTESERLNRWCARECERSSIKPTLAEITLHDFSTRLYNQPWKHEREIC